MPKDEKKQDCTSFSAIKLLFLGIVAWYKCMFFGLPT